MTTNLNLKTYLIAAVVVAGSYYVGFLVLADYLNSTQSAIIFTALCVGWMILVGNKYDDGGDWDGGAGWGNADYSGDDDSDDGGGNDDDPNWMEHLLDEIAAAAPEPAPVPPTSKPAVSADPILQRKRQMVATQKLSGFTAEAAIIDDVLRKHKLAGQVDFTQKETIVLANTFASYIVKPTGSGILQFSQLENATDMIAREIKEKLRKDDDEDVQVVAVNSQPHMTFQVNRRKPQPLLWDERPKDVGEMSFTIGFRWRGAKRVPVTLRMGGVDSDYVTGAVWGQPGSGKSTVLNVIVNDLCLNTSPEKVQFYGIDTHHDTWSDYAGLPHFRNDGQGGQTAADMEGAMQILDLFASWCDKRNAPSDGVCRVLVVDEMQKILTHTQQGKVALDRLRTIMAEGRKRLIRVITATQNPDAKSYPTELKPLTGWMAYAKITNDRYLTHELRLPSARTLLPKRELNFYGPEGFHRLSAFWLPPEENEKVITEIARKWQDENRSCPSAAVPTASSSNQLGAIQTSVPAGQAVANWTARLDAETPWAIQNRPLSQAEAKRLREIVDDQRFVVRGRRSQNAIIDFVWASGTKINKIAWVKQALNG